MLGARSISNFLDFGIFGLYLLVEHSKSKMLLGAFPLSAMLALRKFQILENLKIQKVLDFEFSDLGCSTHAVSLSPSFIILRVVRKTR